MYWHGLYVLGARPATTSQVAATAPLGVFAIERFTEAEHMREHRFEHVRPRRNSVALTVPEVPGRVLRS